MATREQEEMSPDTPRADQYPSQATSGDHLHLAARVLISTVPGAGGPILEVMNALIASPLNKRRDDWFVRLASRLDKMESSVAVLSLEKLGTNEQFISACASAMLIAVRTHHEAKLEALVNATLNSALMVDLDGTRDFMYMRWIDEMSPLHLRVLRVLADPLRSLAASDRDGSLLQPDPRMREVLNICIPGYDAEPNGFGIFTAQIEKDLKTMGLLRWDLDPSAICSHRISELPFISEIGERFLRYIEIPGAHGCNSSEM